MSKIRLISIIAIVLFIINVSLVGFHIMKRPPRGHGPKNEIIKRLDLDKVQVTKYEILIKNHQSAIRKLDNEIGEIKTQLYTLLIKEKNDSMRDSLIHNIAEKQLAIEQVHFAHFEDIHHICKPNQEEKYKQLTAELSKLFSRDKMKNDPK